MAEKKIKVLDKRFKIFIHHDDIIKRITEISEKINQELYNKDPLFLAILNGSFMFASDLFKRLDINCNISFVKLASYAGTETSGNVKGLIGLNENIKGKTVVIMEDIVDSGITIEHIINYLKKYEPLDIKICTLLLKPDSYLKSFDIDYVGFEIPDDFIIGYGLDYNGRGRNYKHLYTILD